MRRPSRMRRSAVVTAAVAFAACLLTHGRAAAESELARELDKALESVRALEYGKDTGGARDVERIVMQASADAAERVAVEERIIGALRSASTTEGRSFLCRQLRTIGSGKAVPELEKLLADPELSHMARYALLAMEAPEAAAALRRALDKTSGKLQAGIVNTLANRGCREALSDFARLLRSPDAGVAEASARALGRVGGAEAVRALEAARSKAGRGESKSLARCIDNALLVCADGFLADGKTRDAARIYETFYSPDRPKHLRLAGLRGLAAARGPRAVPLLVEAARSGDPYLQRNAISYMALVKGEGATGALVALLTSLPGETQPLLLNALGARGDAAAVRAISAVTKSPNEAVRVAALDALSRAGDESAVGVLAKAATAVGREADVARAGLVRLRGERVDAAITQSIGSGDVTVRVELIRALAGRKAAKAVDVLLVAADDEDEAVRRQAIRALGAVARESDLPALMRLLVTPKEAGDRAAVGQAVGSLFRRMEDKDSQARPVIDALRYARNEARPALVRLLSRPATPAAYEAARAALEDADPDVRDAAVRTLSEWPDPTPAGDLLRVASTGAEGVHKVLALRGYIRMAGMSDDPTAMYVRAMDLTERPVDKKLVLGGLGTASSAEALAVAERYLDDDALQAEAALAAVQIAARLKESDAARAKAALRKIVESVKGGAARKLAQDAINEMEQYEGYILAWVAAGPYSQKGKDSRAVFDTAYPPEKPDAADVKWKRITKGIDAWGVNLESQLGSRDHCGAYVRTRVRSPKEADAQLELGSDDAVKAWLGGKLVHSNYTTRGMSPRQDIVKVRLKEGWNELMLKVVDHEGGWAFCCRIRAADGSALEGLRFEAK